MIESQIFQDLGLITKVQKEKREIALESEELAYFDGTIITSSSNVLVAFLSKSYLLPNSITIFETPGLIARKRK